MTHDKGSLLHGSRGEGAGVIATDGGWRAANDIDAHGDVACETIAHIEPLHALGAEGSRRKREKTARYPRVDRVATRRRPAATARRQWRLRCPGNECRRE